MLNFTKLKNVCFKQLVLLLKPVAPIEHIPTFGSLLELQRLKDHVMAECKKGFPQRHGHPRKIMRPDKVLKLDMIYPP